MKLFRPIALRSAVISVLSLGAICGTASLSAQQPDPQVDNSKQNKNEVKTADKQPNAKSDRLTTASIRKAIIADKPLSIYAHNVKIITAGGAVTLKGPVKSEEEKQKVAADAATIVSADKITNALTVKQ